MMYSGLRDLLQTEYNKLSQWLPKGFQKQNLNNFRNT